VPAGLVSAVQLVGGAEITGAALDLCLQRAIPVVFLDRIGRCRGRIEPEDAGRVADRLRQLQVVTDQHHRLVVARTIVSGKIVNQRALLARRLRRATVLDGRQLLDAHAAAAERAGDSSDLEHLRGVEGAASRRYFGLWRRTLPSELGFGPRDRYGGDVVNALLNYLAALLREAVRREVVAVGLDPQLGCLHEHYRGRPALVFDLMEEFRPPLVDASVLALVGLRAVTAGDVHLEEGRPLLSRNARRAATRRFQDRLHGAATEGLTYHESIHRQVRRYRSSLRDPAAYAAFRWR
jgi:CRISP-associated protein Cas1